MAEEKQENKVSEVKEAREQKGTITIKKDTIWKIGVFVLAVLLVISIFTAGFGIKKNPGTGGVVDGDGDNNSDNPVDLSVFINNPDLYPFLGPANAKNVVIEFADFQCPSCVIVSGLPLWTEQYASQHSGLIGIGKKLEEAARKGELKFIYVPLSFLGDESTYSAEAVLCANEQGKFWEMHDEIFKASDGPSENTGKYKKDKLLLIAQKISGLDRAKFKTCLESGKYSSSTQKIMSDTQSAGIKIATPQFFVNEQSISPNWDSIQSALK